MNAIDFIKGTAEYMAAHRPDVYDMQTAVEEVSTAIDSLREGDNAVECIIFTSFVLIRILDRDDTDDPSEEFIFSHKATGMFKMEKEEGVWAYTFRGDVTDALPGILDLDVDL